MAVDGSDHGQRQIHQGPGHAFKDFMLMHPLRTRHALALFQVAPCAENFRACAGQDHAAQALRIVAQAQPQFQQFLSHARVDGVAHIGAVQGDLQDAICVVFQQESFRGLERVHGC